MCFAPKERLRRLAQQQQTQKPIAGVNSPGLMMLCKAVSCCSVTISCNRPANTIMSWKALLPTDVDNVNVSIYVVIIRRTYPAAAAGCK